MRALRAIYKFGPLGYVGLLEVVLYWIEKEEKGTKVENFPRRCSLFNFYIMKRIIVIFYFI